MGQLDDPLPELRDFLDALGGKIGGHADERGWSCADCDGSGKGTSSTLNGLALYRHRQDAMHWKDDEDAKGQQE